jgi:hypothetical protein
VDLRYNPQDIYNINASSPEEIRFEVSSTKDWEVSGNADWYAINPEKGGPGTIYVVTVNAKENTELDDRIDTVTIKSDYWVGKRFVINQKGTAFIRVENPDTVFTKDAEEKSLTITSNQNWSLRVTKGSEWLSVVSGQSGSQNGSFQLKVVANKGERRFGELSIYDRYDKLYSTLTLIQEGVTLDAAAYSFRVPRKAGVYRLPVESNTEWKISKPDDISWISFNQTTYSGDGIVEINYMENTASSVRSVEFTIETLGGGEDIEPVSKNIVLKQAPTLAPDRHHFNQTGAIWGQWTSLKPVFEDGDLITKVPARTEDRCRAYYVGEAPLGIYSVKVKSTDMTPADMSQIYLGLLFSSSDYRGYSFAVNSDGMTLLEGGGISHNNVPVDYTGEFVITVSVEQLNESLYVEWWLDGDVIATYLDHDLKPLSKTLTILLGFENASWHPGTSLPSVEKGTVFDWWEYSPPVDWGD